MYVGGSLGDVQEDTKIKDTPLIRQAGGAKYGNPLLPGTSQYVMFGSAKIRLPFNL